MIDDVAARLYWPGQDPVGRTLAFGDEARQIIGVVGAVRHGTPGEDAQPHVYFPMLQSRERSMYVVVRTAGDAARVGADLRAIVRSMDPAQPVFAVQTMDEYLDRAVEQPRMRATLVGGFASVGLMLAVLGLYGLLVFTVAARTREVGIRMALGARASQIVTFVGRWSFAVTAAGVGVGLTGAVLMTATMQAMLFGVDQLHGRVYAAVALLFALVAVVASVIPAARAARIDPAVALRHD
jgi:ABC-type antimicrobial peptide transport system permease subunit